MSTSLLAGDQTASRVESHDIEHNSCINEDPSVGYGYLNGKQKKNEQEEVEENTWKKRLKPKCCDRCMCIYICFIVIIVLLTIILIIIYEIIPIMGIDIQLNDLHIELWQYHINQELYFNRFNKTHLSGIGRFLVTAYNGKNIDVYMHNYSLTISALNLYGNQEQFGYVTCCGDIPHFNHTNPYFGNETFVMDQERFFEGYTNNYLDFVLNVTSITKELLYIGYEASFLNDWRLNLQLNGEGWAKTKAFGFDVRVSVFCSIDVNASYFFPFNPESAEWNSSKWNITDNYNDNEYIPKSTLYPNLEDMIGQIPPKKYYLQNFPVIDLNCTFGMIEFVA